MAVQFPQVYYVRIPDPECKQLLAKCQQVLVPVDDPKTQEALCQFDRNHDHVLAGDDLSIDTMTAIPHDVSNTLARRLIATHQKFGSQRFFTSPESLLSWVKARAAVDQAYETIQWLGSLGSRPDYVPTAWQQIEGRLGTSARDYTEQVIAASRAFDAAVSFPEYKLDKVNILSGYGETSKHHGVSYLIDQRALSPALQLYMNETLAKMIAIFEFDRTDGIRCKGDDCPRTSREATGLHDNNIHLRGLMIVVRTDDIFSHTPQFNYFTTHYFVSSADKALEYATNYLRYTAPQSYNGE